MTLEPGGRKGRRPRITAAELAQRDLDRMVTVEEWVAQRHPSLEERELYRSIRDNLERIARGESNPRGWIRPPRTP